VGAAAEEVGDAAAPLPNCPARKTCAALASFDLMSCAGAVFAVSEDAVPGFEGTAGLAAEGVVTGAAFEVSELPATGAAVESIWTLTAKLPLQGGAPEAFTPR
jgi:hypothetical protein